MATTTTTEKPSHSPKSPTGLRPSPPPCASRRFEQRRLSGFVQCPKQDIMLSLSRAARAHLGAACEANIAVTHCSLLALRATQAPKRDGSACKYANDSGEGGDVMTLGNQACDAIGSLAAREEVFQTGLERGRERARERKREREREMLCAFHASPPPSM